MGAGRDAGWINRDLFLLVVTPLAEALMRFGPLPYSPTHQNGLNALSGALRGPDSTSKDDEP